MLSSWARRNSDLGKNSGCPISSCIDATKFPHGIAYRGTCAKDVFHGGLELPDFINRTLGIGWGGGNRTPGHIAPVTRFCSSDIRTIFRDHDNPSGRPQPSIQFGIRESSRPRDVNCCRMLRTTGTKYSARIPHLMSRRAPFRSGRVGCRALSPTPIPDPRRSAVQRGHTASPDIDHAEHYCPPDSRTPTPHQLERISTCTGGAPSASPSQSRLAADGPSFTPAARAPTQTEPAKIVGWDALPTCQA
ncbi:hypothetical protein EVAR_87412_1 [Eumeta japonica]|uniref:Uncharacterized protein n=1 Tax=Eumeta variegata TaxID=151549 RepID=A0A4C1XIV1_EUMVA|nr:hypothetical protein EVAR_87412_1 [Eumeta japonica]